MSLPISRTCVIAGLKSEDLKPKKLLKPEKLNWHFHVKSVKSCVIVWFVRSMFELIMDFDDSSISGDSLILIHSQHFMYSKTFLK